MSTTIRCVCAAALERARAAYGHLDGRRVWVRFAHSPTSRYMGILRVLKDRPGYLLLERANPDTNRTAHLDDITEVTLD
ncbi:hypothetical protein [Nocardiopsis dassonvillei]|uniref:hypothetical protein n=1 Tax=Nocardiopsis dassonvillei TaxID=2014 RepID=UPI003F564EA7